MARGMDTSSALYLNTHTAITPTTIIINPDMTIHSVKTLFHIKGVQLSQTLTGWAFVGFVRYQRNMNISHVFLGILELIAAAAISSSLEATSFALILASSALSSVKTGLVMLTP